MEDLKYDFNRDGKVDLLDIMILIQVNKAFPGKFTPQEILDFIDEVFNR